MDFWKIAINIIFLLQTITGILGNCSFLYYYLVHYGKSKLKPTDLIHMHLLIANTLIILSKGVPYTTVAFGLKQFLNDLGCRLILYIERIGRSVSIGTTCLLSVFQATIISQKEFCCKVQKVKAAKYIRCSIVLLWILYMLINLIFFMYLFIERNIKNVTRKRNFGYCSTSQRNEINDSLYAALIVCPEVFFALLMVWSSGAMIITLHRHKQRVQNIHNTCSSSRICFESRATHSILVLVSTFLAFYTLSSILQGCIALLYTHTWWMINITRLTSLCFPCFGPFVIMNHYSVVPTLKLVWIRNKKTPFTYLSI